MGKAKPVVIDTDPGLDDALALALALRSPVLDVLAVTVVAGNTSLAACTSNALRILEVVDPEHAPPVYEGCAHLLSPRVARAEHVHGSDGIGGASSSFPVRRLGNEPGHACDALIDLARLHRERLTVISLGPPTNIATAWQRDARAMEGIGELVVMGGSADGRGNATPVAEFNFYSDPAAAKAVVRSRMPVTLVGLNVTEKALLARDRFNRALGAMPGVPLRSFLEAVSRPYFDFCRKERGTDACAMHDPLAVGAAIDSSLLTTERMRCDVVDAQGLTRGMVLTGRLCDSAASRPQSVATAVEAGRFADLFLETVCAP